MKQLHSSSVRQRGSVLLISLIMLLVLFFSGAGRFVSLDYWIARRCWARARSNV